MAYTILIRDGNLFGIHPHANFQSPIPEITTISSEDIIPDLNRYYWDNVAYEFKAIENPRVLTKLQFNRRFTSSERIAIDGFNTTYQSLSYLSTETKNSIKLGLDDYALAQDINLDDPGTIGMLTMYVALGIITDQRKTEILI